MDTQYQNAMASGTQDAVTSPGANLHQNPTGGIYDFYLVLCEQLTPSNRMITLTPDQYKSLNQHDRKFITENLQELLDSREPIIWVEDHGNDKYYLGEESLFPIDHMLVVPGKAYLLLSAGVVSLMAHVGHTIEKAKAKPVRKNDGDKVPRPCNAFILYRKHWHETVKAQYPGMHNNQLSKIIGNKWKSEPNSVRAEWKAMSIKKAQEHALLHPDYQYRPRKPSEKKRRMTKAKAASLAAVVARSPSAASARQPVASDSMTVNVVQRFNIVSSEEASKVQEDELNNLPWDFFMADLQTPIAPAVHASATLPEAAGPVAGGDFNNVIPSNLDSSVTPNMGTSSFNSQPIVDDTQFDAAQYGFVEPGAYFFN